MVEKKVNNMVVELVNKFRKPDVKYRPASFWSWNYKLKLDELKRQVDEMCRVGQAAGFMHSRMGLITKYFSREWFYLIKEVVRYCHKKGTLCYLYDEDRWPSGFAGGRVTKYKKYRMQQLVGIKSNDGWTFKVRHNVTELGLVNRAWFNGQSYVDTLKPEAIRKFIEITYEGYYRHVGKYFGKTVPAIFIDEPNYFLQRETPIAIPWTDKLPKKFYERYGYHIKEALVSLFEDVGEYYKVRYHFWRLVAEMFQESWAKQLYEWCDKKNIALTGHYLWEEPLSMQVKHIGSAMALYEYMHIPGVDHLGRHIRHTLTLKQCTSVAHQLDKKRVLSELYGCSGQGLTFLERKWIGDWHVVLGVNFFCPHLWSYSVVGCRKRDYPPTLSHHQPYWKYDKILEDYFTRLHYILSQGKPIVNIGVIHPIETAWCLYKPGSTELVDRLNDRLVELLNTLLGEHYDFDLIDESLLEKYGVVEADSLRVQAMKYDIIIIPALVETLRRNTIELLHSFLQQNKHLYLLSDSLKFVEGVENSQLINSKLCGAIKIKDIGELIEHLEKDFRRPLEIKNVATGKEENKIYCYLCAVDDVKYCFICNIDKENGYTVDIYFNVIEDVENTILEKWEPLNGEVGLFPASVKNGKLCVENMFFPPCGSMLFCLRKRNKRETELKKASHTVVVRETRLGKEWDSVVRLAPNIFVLDRCRYMIGQSGKLSKAHLSTIELQRFLEKKVPDGTQVAAVFNFKTNFNKRPANLFLCLECPWKYSRIVVNNYVLDSTILKSGKQWIDPDFIMYPVGKYINPAGENEICLVFRFWRPVYKNTYRFVEKGTEFEPIYLLGDFRVAVERIRRVEDGFELEGGMALINEDSAYPVVDPSDLISSGYPFYAGSMKLIKKFRYSKESLYKNSRVFLKLSGEGCEFVVAEVSVNYRRAGVIPWGWWEVDVTGFLKNGENILELVIVSSLRNVFGPHHDRRGVKPEGVGPHDFEPPHAEAYQVLPFGFSGEVVLLEKRV
jgi:hypothetical protein